MSKVEQTTDIAIDSYVLIIKYSLIYDMDSSELMQTNADFTENN